jgi:hypothetical protein
MVENVSPIANPTVRYEPSDASFRPILLIMLGAMVFMALVFGIVLEFFYRYRDYQADVKKSSYPLAHVPANDVPRDPRLEQVNRLKGDTSSNVREREAGNLKVLNSYGPTREEGFVHVPIERAMEQLLEQKALRSRPEPSAEQQRRSSGLVDSGAPNSGRLFIKGEPK